MNLQKDSNNIPWFNAYERIHFNRGYDSSVEWTANTAYRVGDIIRPTATQLSTNPPLRSHEWTVTVAGNSGPTPPPNFVSAMNPPGATITANGVTYQERQPTAYPLTLGGAPSQSNTPWLYFIGRGDISVVDPWFHARTAQNDLAAPNGNAQPWSFPFNDPATSVVPLGNNQICGTHHFQFQSFDQY